MPPRAASSSSATAPPSATATGTAPADAHAEPQLDPALADALGRVGDRWSLLVVAALLGGPRRFGDLLASLDGLAPNILSKRLGHLEAEGLVVGEPYSRRPVRHAYRLTAAGAELAGVLRLLAHWEAHRTGATPAGRGGAPRHAACGTPVEARWYCPTCDQALDDPEDDNLRWL